MTKVNQKILNELLSQPGVKENVEKMTPVELDWYKALLVSQGIYASYVRERRQEKDKT